MGGEEILRYHCVAWDKERERMEIYVQESDGEIKRIILSREEAKTMCLHLMISLGIGDTQGEGVE